MSFLRTVVRLLAFLPGILIQLIGMVCTLLGFTLLALGTMLRIAGGILAGVVIVTRGLVRGVAALRA